MPRRKKNQSKRRYPSDVPYVATPEEIRRRFGEPMTGFVCGTCGWIYIQAGQSGRRACPKCRSVALRRYPCESFDQLSRELISREVEHDDPIGNDVLVRRRFADAYERFMRRLDDWKTAETLAQDIDGGIPSRALVAKVYSDLKAKKPEDRKKRRQPRPRKKLRLEELEAERREAERDKIRQMKKGIVRKKLL